MAISPIRLAIGLVALDDKGLNIKNNIHNKYVVSVVNKVLQIGIFIRTRL